MFFSSAGECGHDIPDAPDPPQTASLAVHLAGLFGIFSAMLVGVLTKNLLPLIQPRQPAFIYVLSTLRVCLGCDQQCCHRKSHCSQSSPAKLAHQLAFHPAGLFGVFSAVLVGVAMTYLMPLIQHMPLNALAAIITSGVLGLFDYHEGFHLFRVSSQVLAFIRWLCSVLHSLYP